MKQVVLGILLTFGISSLAEEIRHRTCSLAVLNVYQHQLQGGQVTINPESWIPTLRQKGYDVFRIANVQSLPTHTLFFSVEAITVGRRLSRTEFFKPFARIKISVQERRDHEGLYVLHDPIQISVEEDLTPHLPPCVRTP